MFHYCQLRKWIPPIFLAVFFQSAQPLCQERESSFQTDLKKEALILGGGVSLFMAGMELYRGVQPPDSASLKKESIFFMDRFAVRMCSKRLDGSSDLTLAIGCAMPLLVLNDAGVRASFSKHALIYLESSLITAGLVYVSKGLFHRPRPYAYRMPYSNGKNLSSDAARSFFSGHAAFAFNGAVIAGMMMEDARGSRWKEPVWITGMTAASFTALFRVLAGEHFPTDVFAGALAGSAVAFLIFKAHE